MPKIQSFSNTMAPVFFIIILITMIVRTLRFFHKGSSGTLATSPPGGGPVPSVASLPLTPVV